MSEPATKAKMTSVAATRRRKKQQQHHDRFSCLPLAVLFKIFMYKGVLTPANLAISRTLFPVALVVFYRDVELTSRAAIERFGTSLRSRSDVLPAVRHLVLRDGLTHLMGVDEAGLRVSTQVGSSLNALRATLESVKDVFRKMSRLKALSLDGYVFCEVLLARQFLEADAPWPRLVQLEVSSGLSLRGDVAPDLCHNLLYLPTVRKLLFVGVAMTMYTSLLNFDPSVHLPARSLGILHLEFSECFNVFADVRIFFQALSSVRVIVFDGWTFYPNFVQDLALLPPTLLVLGIYVGARYCHSTTTDMPLGFRDSIRMSADEKRLVASQAPKLAAVNWHFPQLDTLTLDGPVITPDTFDLVRTLPRLRLLRLGAHAPFDVRRLLVFLADPPAQLVCLSLDLCECETPADRALARVAALSKPRRRGATSLALSRVKAR
ncbi:hypothetical protein Rhopal_003135-T1 [Rhodotorula paludigena]|uniref:F-box domain-containing protein n=1 Tax=Rhodotorula paludigena TaxID=86838 RepID=A0AAV5GC35_9BASI|nr:hypothetical protein Rhopal_003135-T1 [Rhodotorula paludigena]